MSCVVIRAVFENGYYFYTAFNGTKEEAKAYYVGKYFNVGTVEDDMQKCEYIEFLS